MKTLWLLTLKKVQGFRSNAEKVCKGINGLIDYPSNYVINLLVMY